MRQLAGDEMLGDRREMVLVGAIVESIRLFPRVGEHLVRVHAGAGRAEDRLWHECRQQPTPLRDGLDGVLERDQLVGTLQRIAQRQVKLVLAGGHLVVTRVDRDAKAIERLDDFLPDFASDVDRMVEVARAVMPPRPHATAGGVGVEQEELELHGDRVVEAQRRGIGQGACQHAPRIAGEPLAVRGQQVADHLGALGPVGLADGERAQVRPQEHVTLEDAGEALH